MDENELEEVEVDEVLEDDVEVEVLAVLLLLYVDEVLGGVLLDVVEVNDADVDVAPVLVDIDVELEELDIELVVEVVEVDVLVDVEPVELALVDDGVELEDGVDVELLRAQRVVVDEVPEVGDVLLGRGRRGWSGGGAGRAS